MRRNKISLYLLLLAGLLMVWSPLVYGGDQARIGTAGGVQLEVPVGARDLAMGGSDLAYTKGLDALFWNPAGFSNTESVASAVFSTMTIFNDVNVNYLALGVKAGAFGNLAFSIKAFDFGDIPFTTVQDMDGASGRTFSPTFFTLGLTYAKRLTDAISLGVTGKLVTERIPQAQANAFALDVGLQYWGLGGIDGLGFGVAVKNVGSSIQYDGSGFLQQTFNPQTGRTEFSSIPTQSDELPASIELGVSYKREIAEGNTIILSTDFKNNNLGNDQGRIGGEYAYNDLFFLRAGWLGLGRALGFDDTSYDDMNYRFTLGVGLHFKLGRSDFNLDYAFRDSQYFDGNNLFSVRIGF
ncbi:MAG: hypothetical protein D6715_04840 [Calditrichaeota bacterium]|nr:MAG: hypothetical protein D6715_04840 [Calditrichota bacterium]